MSDALRDRRRGSRARGHRGVIPAVCADGHRCAQRATALLFGVGLYGRGLPVVKFSVWVSAVCAMVLLAASLSPVSAQQRLGDSEPLSAAVRPDVSSNAGATRESAPAYAPDDAETTAAADGGFAFGGQWLAPGVVRLDWDDIEDATGYELMMLSGDGWQLLSGHDSEGDVVAVFEGSAARVGGLPDGADEYWFAVRGRSTSGVSRWSASVAVGVPEHARGSSGAARVFDPFTAPTLSDIAAAAPRRRRGDDHGR